MSDTVRVNTLASTGIPCQNILLLVHNCLLS